MIALTIKESIATASDAGAFNAYFDAHMGVLYVDDRFATPVASRLLKKVWSHAYEAHRTDDEWASADAHYDSWWFSL